MSLRDQFLNAKLGAEIVTIDLDPPVKVEVREKTVDEQYELLDKVRKKDGSLDNKLLAVESILACAYDPESGERVFEAADRDAVRKLPARAFNQLLDAANKAAGLEAEEEVVADLDETPPSETFTS